MPRYSSISVAVYPLYSACKPSYNACKPAVAPVQSYHYCRMTPSIEACTEAETRKPFQNPLFHNIPSTFDFSYQPFHAKLNIRSFTHQNVVLKGPIGSLMSSLLENPTKLRHYPQIPFQIALDLTSFKFH